MAGIAQDRGQDRGMQGVAPPGLMAPEPPGDAGEALRRGPMLKEGPRLNQPPAAEAAPPPGGKAAPGSKGAAAEASPDQRDKLLTELYARLATAPDEATASEVATAVEQLWMHSGSATADLLVARAAAAIEAQRRDLAMQLLNAAVELQPDYAEAWNRRAYLFYIEDDYKRALGDLRRVLALEPHHYKALEGLANILQHLGEKKAALEAYESLLKVHPNASGAKKTRDELKTEVEGQGI
jgi:tetratricopeptide (TPR) repeat protein